MAETGQGGPSGEPGLLVEPVASREQPKPARPDVSVVLPVVNERDNLIRLIPQLGAVLRREGLSFEILVIDGGSSDGTQTTARELGARVMPERRRGYAGALETGLAEARGDYVVTMDADLSHDPRFVPRMWRARALGDIVIASRYIRGGASHGPILRKELSRLLNEVHRWALLMPVRDLSSGFRLYRRETVDGVKLEGHSFEAQQELLVEAYGRGFSVVEVPFTYFPRAGGRSHAHLLRLAIGYTISTYRLRELRNQPDAADCDERAFYTLKPISRIHHRRRHRVITSWARSAERTLHVGCGSELATQSLNDAIGADANLGKLRFLRRYGIAVVCAKQSALPFRDKTFDCLILSEFRPQEPAIDSALREMARVLSPAAMLIVVPPYRRPGPAESPPAGPGDRRSAETAPAEPAAACLVRNGFIVEESFHVRRGEEIVRCRKSGGENPS